MVPFSSTSASPKSSPRCRRGDVHVATPLFGPGSPRSIRIFLLLLFLPLFLIANGQNRKDLEKKRDALDKQIRTTSALIDQARKEQKNTEQQLHLLDAQIRQREELIRTMNGELFQVDQQIQETEAVITSLRDDLDRLKVEYGRMVQFAFLHRNASDRLSYIFAAGSFAQAYKRSRYLSQLAEQRQRQAALILETQHSLNGRIAELKGHRVEKATLLNSEVDERKRLTEDKGGHQTALSTLKKEEGRLKDTLRKQNKKKSDLESAIRKAIEAEIHKSAPKPTSTPAGKGGAPAKAALSLTPEARELGADFEKNKGKLPWPVEKGTPTSRYGRQPHPVLKGIEINNNGIDIACDKGTPVRTVFRGEVSSIIVIPGAGKAVVVNHGAYRTVYSNLRETTVAKGQKIDTKQQVGVVMTDDDGSAAHIEVWRITAEGDIVTVDPALWLFKN
jgi:septal ring factor EnvC (AmiA/AmiB activator)